MHLSWFLALQPSKGGLGPSAAPSTEGAWTFQAKSKTLQTVAQRSFATVDSTKLEYRPGTMSAGFSLLSSVVGSQDGHVPTSWLLL